MLRRSLGTRLPFRSCISRAYTAPVSDISFLLDEVLQYPRHCSLLGYTPTTCGPDIISAVIQESARFAEHEIAPLSAVADQEGCTYVGPNEVKTPTGFKEAYKKYVEGGWVGLSFPTIYGGQGLPNSLSLLQAELLGTACQPWTSYTSLSKGAARTLLTHASESVQELFLPNLISGAWTGTMCLTESQCGSDLNQVRTRADLQEDGCYSINGTKIFISCAEHDLTDNIVHLVLARIPGGPSGTKGLSLFVVPKFDVKYNGQMSSTVNGVSISRLEDKMGYHGTPTCEVIFENARGYLVGTEHSGMANMFTFMNTARIGSAMQGVNAAEKSYQNALDYSKSRRAFRSATGVKSPDHEADMLIVHPDIRKMLLTQKAFSEGGRAMIYSCALIGDKMICALDRGEVDSMTKYDAELGFLTPILKGFLTERGIEAANIGIQIYGGHGYIRGNKQEQILRDVRISAIWEGTTGIQALDFLRRKVFGKGLKNFEAIDAHCNSIRASARELSIAGCSGSVRNHSDILGRKAEEWAEVTRRVSHAVRSDPNSLGASSVDYLMYAGYITLAQQWLEMEAVATAALLRNDLPSTSRSFYESKILVSKFVFSNILPRTEHLKVSMVAPVDHVMGLDIGHFSSDY